MWSYSGPINGMQCLKMTAEEPQGLEENYLCAGNNNKALLLLFNLSNFFFESVNSGILHNRSVVT